MIWIPTLLRSRSGREHEHERAPELAHIRQGSNGRSPWLCRTNYIPGAQALLLAHR